MGRIVLPKEAAMRAIAYSNDARDQLRTNINIMDNNVNSLFSGLQDPAFSKYLEMSEQMQDLLKQISRKMDEVSQYCEALIRWIDNYSEN